VAFALIEPHAPGEVISTDAAFDAPVAPMWPPVATMYTMEALEGQVYPAAMLTPPFESVVKPVVVSSVGAEPFPVVPAVYT
jgi:hypothetical protein